MMVAIVVQFYACPIIPVADVDVRGREGRSFFLWAKSSLICAEDIADRGRPR